MNINYLKALNEAPSDHNSGNIAKMYEFHLKLNPSPYVEKCGLLLCPGPTSNLEKVRNLNFILVNFKSASSYLQGQRGTCHLDCAGALANPRFP